MMHASRFSKVLANDK